MVCSHQCEAAAPEATRSGHIRQSSCASSYLEKFVSPIALSKGSKLVIVRVAGLYAPDTFSAGPTGAAVSTTLETATAANAAGAAALHGSAAERPRKAWVHALLAAAPADAFSVLLPGSRAPRVAGPPALGPGSVVPSPTHWRRAESCRIDAARVASQREASREVLRITTTAPDSRPSSDPLGRGGPLERFVVIRAFRLRLHTDSSVGGPDRIPRYPDTRPRSFPAF